MYNKEIKLISVFTAFIVTMNFIASIVAGNVLHLFGWPITSSIIISPWRLIIFQILTEFVGRKKALFVMFTDTAISIFTWIFFLILIPITTDPYYLKVIHMMTNSSLASILVNLIGISIAILSYAKIHNLLPSLKWLWLRNDVSTILAGLISPVVFQGIVHGLSMQTFQIISFSWAVRLLLCITDTGLVYGIVILLKKLGYAPFLRTGGCQ